VYVNVPVPKTTIFLAGSSHLVFHWYLQVEVTFNITITSNENCLLKEEMERIVDEAQKYNGMLCGFPLSSSH
jgi:hypothetical protein